MEIEKPRKGSILNIQSAKALVLEQKGVMEKLKNEVHNLSGQASTPGRANDVGTLPEAKAKVLCGPPTDDEDPWAYGVRLMAA